MNRSQDTTNCKDALKLPPRTLIFVLCFFLFISAPSFLTFVQSTSKISKAQEYERRSYAQWPAISNLWINGEKYTKDFETAFNDRFGFRLDLVQTYAFIRFYLFGVTSNDKVLVGSNGWFFAGRGNERVEGNEIRKFDNLSDIMGQNPFSETELRHWGKILSERKSYLESNGSKYLFTIAPRKALIYPEHLPFAVRFQLGENRLVQLLDYLSQETQVPTVNLVDSITQHKSKGTDTKLYFKGDGHWTPVGAFWAYQALVNKLGDLFPEKHLSPLRIDQFEVVESPNWTNRGFNALLGFSVNETFPAMRSLDNNPLSTIKLKGKGKSRRQLIPADPEYLKTRSRLAEHGVGKTGLPWEEIGDRHDHVRHFVHIQNFGTPEFESIVVLGDSFAEKLLYYLSAHAKHLYHYRSVLEFSPDFFEQAGYPDIVIHEVYQGYLGDGSAVNDWN
ncbi:MAG: hypothetical protein KDD53_01985 [Bdellovibrionales bacterium]|nr:hypothetical protein [Bdellovibrionales bacterium]